MKKNIIISIVFLLFSTVIMADELPGLKNINDTHKKSEDFLLPDGYFNINYNLGWGLGSMNDFISENSYRGFSIDGRKFLNDKFTIGGYMGWTGFYEKRARKTYPLESGTITGVASTTYYNFTMGMNAHFYPFPGNKFFKPYIGLGMGPVYQTLQIQMGMYYIEDENWQFMIAPEVGLFIPFGEDSDVGVNTGIRYNLVSYQNTKYGFDNGISYMQWFIGISFEY
jgi:outer membrane protein